MNDKRKPASDRAADGDESINTKRSFLLSFPGKNRKNTAEPGSNIVDAKTINGESDRPKDPRPERQARKDAEPKNNTPKETPAEKNGDDRSRSGRAPRSRHGRHGGEAPKDAQNTPAKESTPEKDRPEREKKNDRPQNAGSNAANAHTDGKNRDRFDRAKNEKGKNPPRKENKPASEHKTDDPAAKNDGASRRSRRGGRNKKGREEKHIDLPGLSPLSSEMRAYENRGGHRFSSDISLERKEKEPSLEEKYKDAVPLADQIAEEEKKRRHKPRAVTTEAIDRTRTLNTANTAPAPESTENAETPEKAEAAPKAGYEVVGVRFREAGKIYYFDPDGKDIPFGTPVIVETSRGSEYGYTAISNRLVPAGEVVPPLKKLKRVATERDTERHLANKALEADAAEVFKKKVAELKLAMNLVCVEYTFDNSKLLFYFTAENRIDFRELVKELAAIFRTRIELRQIGVRDEAKIIGGMGVCGRSCCCSAFMGDFAQVSIKMAKDQGLSLNAAKISGTCGKLMCCLRFEDKVYEEEGARTPKVGAIVETPEGKGAVTEANALRGSVKVALESAPDAPAKVFGRDEVKVVGYRKGGKNNEKEEELSELAELEDKN